MGLGRTPHGEVQLACCLVRAFLFAVQNLFFGGRNILGGGANFLAGGAHPDGKKVRPGSFGAHPKTEKVYPKTSEGRPAAKKVRPKTENHHPAASGGRPAGEKVHPADSGASLAGGKSAVFSEKVTFTTVRRALTTRINMKTATWDSGLTFDDPNLRWGSPSYLLEPGDPGYIDPSPSVNQTKKKAKTMKHNNYYPSRIGDQLIWLITFLTNLPKYTATLGLNAAAVTAIIADGNWLVYVMELWLPATRTWSLACTKAVTDAQTGTETTVQPLPVFAAPALPAGTVAVLPGALTRIFEFVQQIRKNPKCTDAIALDLGILGSATTPPDLTALQPVIDLSVVSSHVFVKWGWGGYGQYLDSCEIWVDRGDGKGWVFLTIDTTPNYTDTTALPTAPAKWSYKAIYRVGETQVGVWSAPVSITVAA